MTAAVGHPTLRLIRAGIGQIDIATSPREHGVFFTKSAGLCYFQRDVHSSPQVKTLSQRPSQLLAFFTAAACFFESRALAQDAAKPLGELSADRIAQIADWLPAKPAGFGHPIQDRAYWSSPSLVSKTEGIVKRAKKLLTQEFPLGTARPTLDDSITGSRARGLAMMSKRESWLNPWFLPSVLKTKGAFSLINGILESYASQPTWTWPFHDKDLRNFRGEERDVDLNSATFGHLLAQTLYLLNDNIRPPVREHLGKALKQRLFDPFLHALAAGRGCSWLGNARHPVQNNWNCVCLASMVGAALTVVPDPKERALYVAAGEHFTRYYLNSIPIDGYCGEGVGYWNYGFGHLALLREEIMQATGGRLDLFASPRIADNALYGVRILIAPEAIPPFADCRYDAEPDHSLISYCDKALRLGLQTPDFDGFRKGNLVESLCPVSPCERAKRQSREEDPLRFYFDKAGVLACRPSPRSPCNLGVGIKAGGNGSHSHNDIGSYSIALGNDKPCGDPGGPVYDRSTFDAHRYDHSILNSYGHPVPVIGGKLQYPGGQGKAFLSSRLPSPRSATRSRWTSRRHTMFRNCRN